MITLPSLQFLRSAVFSLIGFVLLSACQTGSSGNGAGSKISLDPNSQLGLPSLEREIQVIGGTARVSSARTRTSWRQAAGRADHSLGHAQFSDIPSPVWAFVAGEAMSRGRWTSMEPLIANKTAYVLSWDQRLSAVDLITGQAKWQRRLESSTESEGVFGGGIALMNQTLYAATGAGELHSINPTSGETNWTVALSGPSRSGPLAFQGNIYVTDIVGTVTAFDQSGNEKWQHPAPQSFLSILAPNTPAGSDNGIYQVLPNGTLRALLPSGQEAWQYFIGMQGTSGRAIDIIPGAGALPVVNNNFLLISSWANRTVALAANTGEMIWDVPIGSSSTPLVTSNYIFLVTKDGVLRALQRETGYQVWATNLGNESKKDKAPTIGWHGPLLAGGNLIVGSSEGTLKFFSPQTGEQRLEFQVGSPIVAPLSLADETLLVTTLDGLIRAYR